MKSLYRTEVNNNRLKKKNRFQYPTPSLLEVRFRQNLKLMTGNTQASRLQSFLKYHPKPRQSSKNLSRQPSK